MFYPECSVADSEKAKAQPAEKAKAGEMQHFTGEAWSFSTTERCRRWLPDRKDTGTPDPDRSGSCAMAHALGKPI